MPNLLNPQERNALLAVVAVALAIASVFFLVGIRKSAAPPPPSTPQVSLPAPPFADEQLTARTLSAEILSVRVLPYSTPAGVAAVSIVCTWRNNGTSPIGALFADIQARGPGGHHLDMSPVRDYCIYVGRPVQPGETVTETSPEDGFIFLSDGYAATQIDASMRVSRAIQK